MMQTNFKKQENDTLRTLSRDRDKAAEEIGYLISQRDSSNSDLVELRDMLQELNNDIETIKGAKKQENKFTEILNSGDYSTLAREYRRLNTEIYNGRKYSWYTYMEGSSYLSEGEIRQQRRDVGDKMLEAEMNEYELNEKKDEQSFFRKGNKRIMNQYVVLIRNEKGKLVETERIEATDILDAIWQTNDEYDVIEKLEEKDE